MNWIHQAAAWLAFHSNSKVFTQKLAHSRHRQRRFLGRMESLGFDLRTEAHLNTLTEATQSSAIEEEKLNSKKMQFSIRR